MGRKEKDHRYSMDGKYIVRLWDGSDRLWIDVSASLSLFEAAMVWHEKTNGATVKTQYSDFDYYDIFPTSTTMLNSTDVMDPHPRSHPFR